MSSIYSALWSSGKDGFEKFDGVRIPHTIVYRMNLPHDWYLSSASSGQLLRRPSVRARAHGQRHQRCENHHLEREGRPAIIAASLEERRCVHRQ